MTIIDRDAQPLTDHERASLARLESSTRAAGDPREPEGWSLPARVLLATLSAGAGAIHLAMVPSHASEWLPEGIAFAVAGWLQIGFAVLILARPSRGALRLSCILNVAFIAAWVVSRIWGLPVGPEAGVPHAASFVDITCVALEAVLVVAGYELMVKPRIGEKLGSAALVVLSIIPVAVLVVATAAIASPSAADHGHGAETAAGGAGHDHGDASTLAADGHDHGTPTTAVDDLGLSQIMNGAGEGGGHVHDTSVVELDAATQAQLDAQLAQTQPFIEKYPTVKDAEAAGYHRQGPFSPGLGAHYAGGRGSLAGVAGPDGSTAVTDAMLQHPTLIYDGIEPDSKLAGFMYNIFSTDTQTSPEGFAGGNDHWHYHTNVCIVMRPDGGIDAPLGADTTASKELCDQYGGFLIANTGYMVHVWPVPGYESPQGLFSNLNAQIKCPNGTYYIVPPEEIGTRSNTCKDVPA